MESIEKREAAIAEAIAIMARLRGPDGCPWDREQTFDSIKRHTLEETYEVFDAIERRAWPDLKDELGDLLLQVLFYSQMAAEAGYFDIHDVAANLNAKLIRRHPHIFSREAGGGDVTATDADVVLRNWEQIKLEEKKTAGLKATSLLDEVPRSMPPLLEAGKLGSKAAKVGFDWPNADGRATELFAKLDEEIEELKVEVAAGSRELMEAELGDLLFTAVNLARHLKVDPDAALRGANAKFRRRFAGMEAEAGGAEALRGMDVAGLEGLWAQVKGQRASSIKNGMGEGEEIRSSDFVEG